jgi:hypothetical protein
MSRLAWGNEGSKLINPWLNSSKKLSWLGDKKLTLQGH